MRSPCYLVDTGALIALFDRKDPAHALVRDGWTPLSGKFVTTAAVITETFHFVQPMRGGASTLATFLRKGLVTIEEAFTQERIDAAVELMERYNDIPMDFADATLVLLAEHLETPEILTLDERGFRTFRYAKRKRFKLVLQDH